MTLKPIYHPHIVDKPVDNHGGLMTHHYGLILHVQAGDNSPYGWFHNPDSQVSSTWWVSKSGVIEQYVDPDVTAWAQAAGNGEYNSVETEGFPTEALSLFQCAGLAHLYRYGHRHYHWPYRNINKPGDRGFGWHGMGKVAWGNHPDCPGDIRKHQRSFVLDLAEAKTSVLRPHDPVYHELNELKKAHGLSANGIAGPHVRVLLGL